MEDLELYEIFKDLTQKELDDIFIEACYEGRMKTVKYLFNSSDLNNHAEIHAQNNFALRSACNKGQLAVVKYLLENNADIHAQNDASFRWATEEGNLDIIQFLIFELNIEKTNYIKDFLLKNTYFDVDNMFKLRELNNSLEKELSSENVKSKGVKI